ncbi:glycosyltransferase family 39 protein, partial [Candidatus Parcubacteria bacterium]|nr:glycosyltransferase family 39 protein [Candidatus Parcubacteria bacterium]
MSSRTLIKKLKFPLILTTVYSLLAVIFTWPLVKNFSGSVYGYPGDNFGYIYYLWWWKYALANGLNFSWMPLQEAPFGMPILPESGSVVYHGLTKALAWLTNGVAGYNLALLLTFPLTGLFTYLLVFKISKNRFVSFLAGFIFAFCPYHLWRSYNHLDLAMIQWIPLFFWTLVNWLERKSWRWGLATGGAFSLVMLTNYYYAFFGFFAALFLGGAYVVSRVVKKGWEYFDRELLVSGLAAMAVPAVCTLMFVAPAVRRIQNLETSLVGDLLERPFDSLIGLSARPWDYILPSSDHPVLGRFSQQVYRWIATLTPDWRTQSSFAHERVLFLGFYTIVFSLLALYLRVRRKITSRWVIPFLVGAAAMFLFSMPPLYYWRGVTLYFPSYFLHPLLPMFRTYVRAGVFTLLFAVVLASLGAGYVLTRLKSKRAAAVFCSLLFLF